MNLLQIKDLIASDEYEFLRSNEHLGDKVIMIGLGGSHAYGTNIETSDLDCVIAIQIRLKCSG